MPKNAVKSKWFVRGVSPDLIKQLNIMRVKTGKTLGQLVSEAIISYIAISRGNKRS